MKYRKMPVVIEALRFDGDNQNEIIYWAHGGLPPEANCIITQNYHDTLSIRTLEGLMTAFPGDWIIKGVKGEFYPCKPDIFEVTYSPVTVDKNWHEEIRCLAAKFNLSENGNEADCFAEALTLCENILKEHKIS